MRYELPPSMSPANVTAIVLGIKQLTGTDIQHRVIHVLETEDEKAAQILAIALVPSQEPKNTLVPVKKYKKMPEQLSSAT